jgi:hypothetical protein
MNIDNEMNAAGMQWATIQPVSLLPLHVLPSRGSTPSKAGSKLSRGESQATDGLAECMTDLPLSPRDAIGALRRCMHYLSFLYCIVSHTHQCSAQHPDLIHHAHHDQVGVARTKASQCALIPFAPRPFNSSSSFANAHKSFLHSSSI